MGLFSTRSFLGRGWGGGPWRLGDADSSGMPDVTCILTDGSITGKLANTRNVADAHASPLVLFLKIDKQNLMQ